MDKLIKNSVHYKIFDKNYTHSSHIYRKKDTDTLALTKEIKNNREAIVNYFSANGIVVLKQVHGSKIIDADIAVGNDDFVGDGVVTTKENLVLAIQTADCVPVLFASDDGKVIGATHCGWRSSKLDIINNVVRLMQDKGARVLKAIIGPAIAQRSYEVDQNYYDSFLADESSNSVFFINAKRAGYYMLDLPAYVKYKLNKANVSDILQIDDDTYSNPNKYPSYRRSVHSGEIYNQNILSTIVKKTVTS